jgi:hypothetical protein
MGQVDSQAGDAGNRQKRLPSLTRLIATWVRVVFGLALAGEGGVLFADARTHYVGHGAWMGLAAMAAGSLLGLSGLYAFLVQARGPRADQDALPVAPEPAVPMLGALLVYKYRLVTEEQLAEALEIQRKANEPRPRIGSILLEMGLLSMAQLHEALAYQRSLALGEVSAAALESALEDEPEPSDAPVAAP